MNTSVVSISQKSRNKSIVLFVLFCVVFYLIPLFNVHCVAIPSFEQAADFDEEEIVNVLKQLKPILTRNFLITVISVLAKIVAISAALYYARYLFPRFKNVSFFEWIEMVCISQSIFVVYAIIMSAIRYFTGSMNVFDIESFFSLYTLLGNNGNSSIAWMETTLRSVNILELAFFICLSISLKFKAQASTKDSFLYVLMCYGSVFVLFVVAMLMVTLFNV